VRGAGKWRIRGGRRIPPDCSANVTPGRRDLRCERPAGLPDRGGAAAGATSGTDLPDGQITRLFRNDVKPSSEKYFSFPESGLSPIVRPSRSHQRGASRSSRT
jgi:hypothetical protein